ncbi:Hpt domain-containing protein [bacterium]|nr:Hpt domain-containing protein [bacterium]
MYIDNESLDKIRDIGGDSLVEKMVRLFLEHAPKNYQLAMEAKQNGDLKKLSEYAHAIKSSSGNFGAHPLFNASQNVEQLAREGKADEAMQAMIEFDEAFQKTVEAMNNILDETTK